MDNFLLAKKAGDSFSMADMLDEYLPKKAGVVRIHVGGDFFNPKYFYAWMLMAIRNPTVLFYAYTKSIPFWIENRKIIPENFVLTASKGSRCDNLIGRYRFRKAVVVGYRTEAERQKAMAEGARGVLPSAEKLGLEIDSDDSHAADPSKRGEHFALLIHGTQPAGSEAGKAVKSLKGIGSYGKGNN